ERLRITPVEQPVEGLKLTLTLERGQGGGFVAAGRFFFIRSPPRSQTPVYSHSRWSEIFPSAGTVAHYPPVRLGPPSKRRSCDNLQSRCARPNLCTICRLMV